MTDLKEVIAWMRGIVPAGWSHCEGCPDWRERIQAVCDAAEETLKPRTQSPGRGFAWSMGPWSSADG